MWLTGAGGKASASCKSLFALGLEDAYEQVPLGPGVQRVGVADDGYLAGRAGGRAMGIACAAANVRPSECGDGAGSGHLVLGVGLQLEGLPACACSSPKWTVGCPCSVRRPRVCGRACSARIRRPSCPPCRAAPRHGCQLHRALGRL